MSKTVKAREHYGANSLDLTIPTAMVEEYNLSPGDIFEVTLETDENEGSVNISYELVHRTGE